MPSVTIGRDRGSRAYRPEPSRAEPPRGRFRTDIHGLRGIAMVLVVVYHVWGAGRVSGGVDVFLMISAYLMVGGFVRRGTDFTLGPFLVNRFRGLVPQAVLVIMVTTLVGVALLPPARWAAMLDEAAASVLYGQNWLLVARAADYYASDHSAASPLQHYWSMSVQGQVFLLWPLIMAGCVAVARRSRRDVTAVLRGVFTLLGVASFAYACWAVRADPAAAYFDTGARVWEFALPSVVATLPAVRWSGRTAAVVGWTGLVAVLAAGVLVGRGHFPGWPAAVPLLGATLVVLAGSRVGSSGSLLRRVLGARPLAIIADRAYAIYLWHWPVLVFFLVLTDRAGAGVVGGVLVMVVAFALADLTTRIIDRRVQRWPGLRRVPVALGFTALCLALALAVTQIVPRSLAGERAAAADSDHPGAAAIVPGEPAEQPESYLDLAPSAIEITDDFPVAPPPCPAAYEPKPTGSADHMCGQYVPEREPTQHVVIVGNSHMLHWIPMFLPLAEAERWRLDILTYPICDLRPPAPTQPGSAPGKCDVYNAGWRDYVLRQRPDVVIGLATNTQYEGPGEIITPGYVDAMRPLVDAGIVVVSVRDNPRFGFPTSVCVQENGPRSPRCQAPRSQKMSPEPLMEQLAREPGLERTLDLTDQFCPGDVCPSTIGNVYVYQDGHHISATYARTLAPVVSERWRALF